MKNPTCGTQTQNPGARVPHFGVRALGWGTDVTVRPSLRLPGGCRVG